MTIRGADGHILNMGTKFDDFRETANTCYYELQNRDIEVRNNRRLLYNVMVEAGFTNLSSEWRYYDYGTKFWGFFKGEKAVYKGVLELDDEFE